MFGCASALVVCLCALLVRAETGCVSRCDPDKLGHSFTCDDIVASNSKVFAKYTSCSQLARKACDCSGCCATCKDLADWVDKDGYDCSHYECITPSWQDQLKKDAKQFTQFANSKGLSATDACCNCGGGTRADDTTVSTTRSTTTQTSTTSTTEFKNAFLMPQGTEACRGGSRSPNSEECKDIASSVPKGRWCSAGSWGHTVPKCAFNSGYDGSEFENCVHYNNNQGGKNDGKRSPICICETKTCTEKVAKDGNGFSFIATKAHEPDKKWGSAINTMGWVAFGFIIFNLVCHFLGLIVNSSLRQTRRFYLGLLFLVILFTALACSITSTSNAYSDNQQLGYDCGVAALVLVGIVCCCYSQISALIVRLQPRPPEEGPAPLRIHKARFGWRKDIWTPSDCQVSTYYDPVIHGCKDVTDIVRRDVRNNQLILNPHKAKGWMNMHFWPERGLWPPIPRKVAVKYSWGDGPVLHKETAAIPNELVTLVIRQDDNPDQNNGGAAPQPRSDSNAARDHGQSHSEPVAMAMAVETASAAPAAVSIPVATAIIYPQESVEMVEIIKPAPDRPMPTL